MAIKTVTESWENRTVEETRDATTAVRVFSVDFDTGDEPAARLILALNHSLIPKYGNEHPFSRGMYVNKRSVKAGDGAFAYMVTVDYSTFSENDTEKKEDPLEEKHQISWTFNVSNEQVDCDIDNRPIVNSALEPFDPPLTEDKYDLVLSYARNERTFSPDKALRYLGNINSGTFLGCPPKTVKCTVFDGDKIYNDKWGDYYRVTYEFQFRLGEVNGKKNGWTRRLRDQGYRELTLNEDKKWIYLNIKDDAGNQVSQPAPLNDGMEQSKTYTGSSNYPSPPPKGVFLLFDTKKSVSFSPLNIKG